MALGDVAARAVDVVGDQPRQVGDADPQVGGGVQVAAGLGVGEQRRHPARQLAELAAVGQALEAEVLRRCPSPTPRRCSARGRCGRRGRSSSRPLPPAAGQVLGGCRRERGEAERVRVADLPRQRLGGGEQPLGAAAPACRRRAAEKLASAASAARSDTARRREREQEVAGSGSRRRGWCRRWPGRPPTDAADVDAGQRLGAAISAASRRAGSRGRAAGRRRGAAAATPARARGVAGSVMPIGGEHRAEHGDALVDVARAAAAARRRAGAARAARPAARPRRRPGRRSAASPPRPALASASASRDAQRGASRGAGIELERDLVEARGAIEGQGAAARVGGARRRSGRRARRLAGAAQVRGERLGVGAAGGLERDAEPRRAGRGALGVERCASTASRTRSWYGSTRRRGAAPLGAHQAARPAATAIAGQLVERRRRRRCAQHVLRHRAAGEAHQLEHAARAGVERRDARPQRVVEAQRRRSPGGRARWRTSSSMNSGWPPASSAMRARGVVGAAWRGAQQRAGQLARRRRRQRLDGERRGRRRRGARAAPPASAPVARCAPWRSSSSGGAGGSQTASASSARLSASAHCRSSMTSTSGGARPSAVQQLAQRREHAAARLCCGSRCATSTRGASAIASTWRSTGNSAATRPTRSRQERRDLGVGQRGQVRGRARRSRRRAPCTAPTRARSSGRRGPARRRPGHARSRKRRTSALLPTPDSPWTSTATARRRRPTSARRRAAPPARARGRRRARAARRRRHGARPRRRRISTPSGAAPGRGAAADAQRVEVGRHAATTRPAAPGRRAA